ncbi:MAG: efflux RND transporter permease subunit [Gammaproteobacteria bacterium]|nr:efflux RND transporter permease subunit [Gammaproteobacteria bacterium]
MTLTNSMARIPNYANQNRKKLLLSLIVFTLFFAAGIPRIKLDMSMEAFFKKDEPALHGFNVFHYLFGGDQFVMLMFSPEDGDIFSSQSLQRVKQLEDDLNRSRMDTGSELNRITRVRSIYSADYLEATSDALINRKFIGDHLPQTPAEVEAIRQLAMSERDFPGRMFSHDNRLGIMMIQTDYGSRLKDQKRVSNRATDEVAGNGMGADSFDFEFNEESDSSPTGLLLTQEQLPKFESVDMTEYVVFMEAFREVLDRNNWQLGLENQPAGTTGYLAVGNPWIMDMFGRVVLVEMGMYTVVSLLLILIVLYFIVGSVPGMIWPTLIVGIGNVWTMGLIGWTGITVNMLINIIVFLILTVGIAASIHILSGYKQFRAKGIPHDEAMTETLRKTGLPIFLAALTTIAGMLSMSIVPIAPIQSFAWFAAIGVIVTFVLTLFYLPLLMHFWAPKVEDSDGKMIEKRSDQVMQKFLLKVYHLGVDYPKSIVAIFVIFGIIALAGLPRVFIDTNIVTLIKKGVGVQEAFTEIDKKFGGTSTAEILIDSGQADGIKDPLILKAMNRLEQRIKQERPDLVTNIDSLVKLTKNSYQNLTDGSPGNYLIPDDPDILAQTLFSFDSADPATRKLFVDDEWQVGRMTVQVLTQGSSEYEEFAADIYDWIDEAFVEVKQQNPNFRTSVTGSIPLMMEMTAFISKAQLRSYVLVICVIAVLLLVIFGSFKFGMMAMVPNIFPIIFMMGITGWAGIALDTDTLLVMPLAIGIAVDDSIHFLTHYRTELLSGKNSKEAIRSSLTHVGQAMIYTSFVLSLGFLVFLMSVHQGLSNFGILASIAMFSALLADILLLPAMIYLLNPFKDSDNRISQQEVTA